MKALFVPTVLAGVVSCVLVLSALSQQYTFTTIAGSPGVFGAEDGTNSQARFYFPAGVAVDTHGVLYVCDLLNNSIRQVRLEGANWVVRTLAGGVAGFADGTNGQAQFKRPSGIAVDRNGNVFVSDKNNYTIRKLTPVGADWVVTTIAGDPGVRACDDGMNSDAHFSGPAGLVLDGSGRLYVADASCFTIRQVVPDGTNWVVSTLAGYPGIYGGFDDGTNDMASFNAPYAAGVSTAGILFVADFGNHAIRRIEPIGNDWVTTTIAGTTMTNSATGEREGVPGKNDGPGYQASFDNPSGIAVGTGDVLFVADYDNHTIRTVAPAGKSWTVATLAGAPGVAGADDGTASDTRFNHPRDVAVGPTGALFVADYSNHTIRMGVSIPALTILRLDNQAVLSWPLWADAYVLEKSSTLAPAPAWAPWTNGVTVSGDMFVLTNDIAGPAFFRLRL